MSGEEWKTVRRPGYFGKKRDQILMSFDEQYGKNEWRIMWEWNDKVIDQVLAWQIYEDAYFEFIKQGRDKEFLPNGNYFGVHKSDIVEKVQWLIDTAKDVYDTAESNVEAGFSYLIQETPNNHIHDVAIRRALMRNGRWFKGDRLIHVRSSDTEGAFFSPYNIPFHFPELINKAEIEDNGNKGKWWKAGTVEDFYQKNKILQIRS